MMPWPAPWIGFAAMATSIKFGVVAAIERELRPLLRHSNRIRSTAGFAFFEFPSAVVVCGGIGKFAAGKAAQALVKTYHPGTLVSAGFAGAVQPELKVADLLLPAEILDADSGIKFATVAGEGILATITEVADRSHKAVLAASGVSAVDMEAAAVARVAHECSFRFLALKSISDEVNFTMPPMHRFLSPAGKFRTPSFLAYAAMRPAMWPNIRQLAANCTRAAVVLSDALDTLLREGIIGKTPIGAIVRVDA